MTKNLTVGSPMRLIVGFALPTLMGMLFQQFYNLVDTMIVGKLLGAQALAAVGSTGSINFFVIGFCMGVCNGFAIPVAQRMGANELSKMRRFVANAAYLAAAFALVLTVGTGLLCHTILTVMRTPADIFTNANAYIFIIFMGIPTTFLYNLLAGIIRSLGDSKTPVYFLALSSFLNIFLDFALILWFNAGVAGAAIATVLSQAVSAVWILRFLMGRKTILRLKARNMLLQGKIILPCLALGISNFVMVSTESILSVSFTSSLSRYGGDVAVGAMTVLTSVNQLITMPLQGICQGGQPLISYNYGAKKLERVKEAFFCQFLVCVGYTTVFWLLVMAFPKVFAGIFTSDGALVDYTAWAIRIFLAGTFSVGFQVSCQLAFMALGQAKISLIMACLRKLILLIPLIFILPNFFADKAFAVFLAEPVADIIAVTFTAVLFGNRFRKALERLSQEA